MTTGVGSGHNKNEALKVIEKGIPLLRPLLLLLLVVVVVSIFGPSFVFSFLPPFFVF